MVYIVLNITIAFFLGFFTHLMDKQIKSDNIGVGSLAISMLLSTIEAVFFVLILLCKHFWFDALTHRMMQILLIINGILFIMLSFGLVEIAIEKKRNIVTALKLILYVSVTFYVFKNLPSMGLSIERGIEWNSKLIFSPEVSKFFPWTWYTIYNAVIKYIIPVICYVFLLQLQEEKATQLEKYQTAVIGEGFLLMWVIDFIIVIISRVVPAFTLLYQYSHLFLFVVIYMALTKTTVPSGKGLLITFLKTFLSYLLPAFLIGVLCMIFQPVGSNMTTGFIVIFIIFSIICVLFALWISRYLLSSSKLYTADYEVALEKDLASVDYKNSEMDQITERMFEILKRNVEASSMNVYILTGEKDVETAYSSNNMQLKIPLSNPIFDLLLNINKTVVVENEIEKEHDLGPVQEELKKFFELTKSDALFILNEGHNIFGLITLGKKVSGDHYKEYDVNVFVKLYSYFFVFGYYMRNISNKDVIGIVNREIRMASQIITSIQENLDHVKNPKVDIGYMMIPAHSIGGEFIDLIRLTATRHLFVVGDVSGKGLAASMNMVILKSIIRSYLTEVHDFKQLVVKLNTFVRDSLPKGTIFAGLFALIDFETDTMYYINCGIPALMAYTQVYNNVIEIQGSGHILGFVKDLSPYVSVKTTKLNRGDIILACTDGLIQSHSLRGEQFGKERVQQALLENSTYPAQRMAQFTFDTLVKFMSKEMEDDVSILVLKYEGVADENKEEQSESENAENGENTVSETEHSSENEQTPAAEETVEVPADAGFVPGGDAFNIPQADETVSDSFAETDSPAENNGVSVEQDSSNTPDSIPGREDGLPDGMDIPDLSDLDAMMKEAGL
ncbi:MAG: PP2C family protein-serine/threonine phosphatase [Spirochaetales bacterium]|nr:PP2C family protein-serine/threonine phosphatase [Spirochaetales bacterium]